jgi:pimeloyl-ACP methyl ester carboxylesterase
MEDIAAAAEYLASREYVDASKITVIGHAEGADPVLRAVSGDTKIRSFALLCPDIFLNEEKRIEKFRRLAPPAGLASRYDAFIDEAVRRTTSKAAGLKGDWAYLLGKRCYLSENRWRTEAKPIMDVVKQIKIPAMLIQGRNDEALYVEYASVIDKALQEGGNSARVLVYYGNLGRFMGRMVNDCVHRAFYEADKDMMNGIANWIGQAA